MYWMLFQRWSWMLEMSKKELRVFKRSTIKPTETKLDVTATQLAAWRALASFEDVYKYQHFIEPEELIMGPIDNQDRRTVWFIQSSRHPERHEVVSLSFTMTRNERADGRLAWDVKDAVYGYRTEDGQQVGCKFEVLSVRSGGFAPWVFAPPVTGELDPEYREHVYGPDERNRGIYLRLMPPVPTGPRFPK